MDYLEWVNQDVTRSYRYKVIVQKISDCEAKIKENQERVDDLKSGGLVTFGGGDNDPRFRQSEINYHQSYIDDLKSFIESWQEQLSTLLPPSIVPQWVTTPGWHGLLWIELGYRIADMRMSPLAKPTFEIENMNAGLLDTLKYLNEVFDVFVSIRIVDGYFVCTLSYDGISVTRFDDSDVVCFMRTILTFIDLAWEHFIPVYEPHPIRIPTTAQIAQALSEYDNPGGNPDQ